MLAGMGLQQEEEAQQDRQWQEPWVQQQRRSQCQDKEEKDGRFEATKVDAREAGLPMCEQNQEDGGDEDGGKVRVDLHAEEGDRRRCAHDADR